MKCGAIVLDTAAINAILRVTMGNYPEDARVISFDVEDFGRRLNILVESEEFPETPYGATVQVMQLDPLF